MEEFVSRIPGATDSGSTSSQLLLPKQQIICCVAFHTSEAGFAQAQDHFLPLNSQCIKCKIKNKKKKENSTVETTKAKQKPNWEAKSVVQCAMYIRAKYGGFMGNFCHGGSSPLAEVTNR